MSDEMGSIIPQNEDVIYGQDGDQYTCYRRDFVNLQESCCGFGNNHQEALEDLLAQEGNP